jgi:hypothetical protein
MPGRLSSRTVPAGAKKRPRHAAFPFRRQARASVAVIILDVDPCAKSPVELSVSDERGMVDLAVASPPAASSSYRPGGTARALVAPLAERSLRRHGVFAALGKNLFDLGMRAGDDVY